jgi:hypothetical protein
VYGPRVARPSGRAVLRNAGDVGGDGSIGPSLRNTLVTWSAREETVPGLWVPEPLTGDLFMPGRGRLTLSLLAEVSLDVCLEAIEP